MSQQHQSLTEICLRRRYLHIPLQPQSCGWGCWNTTTHRVCFSSESVCAASSGIGCFCHDQATDATPCLAAFRDVCCGRYTIEHRARALIWTSTGSCTHDPHHWQSVADESPLHCEWHLLLSSTTPAKPCTPQHFQDCLRNFPRLCPPPKSKETHLQPQDAHTQASHYQQKVVTHNLWAPSTPGITRGCTVQK